MTDVRERVEDERTVRVFGLDGKALSVGSARSETDAMLWAGVLSAGVAVGDWRGAHAVRFADEATAALGRLAVAVRRMTQAREVLQSWPERPGLPWLDVVNARLPVVEVPVTPGTSAADPDRLDDFRLWCEDAGSRLPALLGVVDLEGVTAEVSGPALGWDDVGRAAAVDVRDASRVSEPGPTAVATVGTTTVGAATYVRLPDLSGCATAVVEALGELAAFVGVVALAFRSDDAGLLSFITDHPELADEVLAGFTDGRLGAESSLVVLLAWFDELDLDGDGLVSEAELRAAICGPSSRPQYVAGAAGYLLANPQLFRLVETVHDGGSTHARDVAGLGGDGRISREDVATFLEFNERLAVVEEHFDTFDTAATPGSAPDGEISRTDLEAMARGVGDRAAAARWLLDHPDQLARLERYETAKPGHLGAITDVETITATSLVLLAVDQQVFADRPAAAGAFVERRFEALAGRRLGGLMSPDGAGAVVRTALTASDQREVLMRRVVAEVANEGAIHNSGLPLAYADGAAANLALLDGHINAPNPTSGVVTDDQMADYLDTHDFLREVSRDPDAAARLREGVFDYGMVETAAAPDGGDGRMTRLRELGRVTTVLDEAQDNALTGAAIEQLRDAAHHAGPGPSAGSVADYLIGHVPVAGTVNDIADAMGVSSGNAIDWLVTQFGVDRPEQFDALDAAEQVDAARAVETALMQRLWLLHDRLPGDPGLAAAVAGRPFVDEHGQLRADLTADEAQALREWVTTATDIGGPLKEDYDEFCAGFREVHSSGALRVEERP